MGIVSSVLGAIVLTAGLGPVWGESLPALPAEEHPSLLFTAAQVPTLKERIQREPYAAWWGTALSRAQSVPDSFTEERSKARYAKSLAFAYLMTDSVSFAARAVEIMKDMKFPPQGGDLGEPHNEGEVVALYAVAYDMLHEYVASTDSTSLEEIRTILAEEAERLRKGIKLQIGSGIFSISIRLHETSHIDNWHLRAYGGLGLAAYALSDHPGIDDKTPQDWADRAYDLVTRTLDFQIDGTDGGYAEGPFYSRYAADVYLPYLFALKNRQGIDLFSDPKVQKMHDWSVNLRLPSGRRPNIEDGHLDDFYGHYLAAVDEDGGAHRWDWENNSEGLYVREFSEMDAIVLYDDSVPAQEPSRGPSVFMSGAGDAVFRSDWSADATYMLLRGEHGRARQQGLGHEHPDETSFVIYAGGEMLAVDAGYINFTNHAKVNKGSSHSVILVDGEGPPLDMIQGESVDGGNDAYIEDSFTSPAMDYAEVRANYQGVDFRRRVMFPGREYFVVADEVRDDETHAYEWRLHGNGGGTSGGTYARTGSLARWTRDQAELIAYLPEREGRTFTESDTIHSFAYLQELTHTALRVQESGGDAGYLAVLYPRRLDEAEPTLTTLTAQGAEVVQVVLDTVQDLTWTLAAGADSTSFAGPDGQMQSDGRFGFVRHAGQALRSFAVQDGRYLRAGEETVFAATDSVDLSLELSRDRVEGFGRGPETGYSLSLPVVGGVETLSFSGTLLDSSLADGILTLQLAGEGDLRLTLQPAAALAALRPASGLDFGKVRVGTSQTLELTVLNQGAARLAVTGISSDNARFAAAPDTLSVAPGDSAAVAVSFAPLQEGTQTGTLSLAGNASIPSLPVSGEGVQPLLSTSADSVDLGAVRVGEQRRQTLILRSAGSDTLRVESVGGLDAPFAAETATVPVLAPGDSHLVSVTFGPEERGSFRDSLRVDSDGGSAAVVVVGRAVEAVLSLPDSLLFGQVLKDSAAVLSLSVVNAGDDTLAVTGISSDNARFSVDLDSLRVAPESSGTVMVRFAPAQEGVEEGRLTVTTSAGSAAVVLRGEGTAAAVEPSPTAGSADFDGSGEVDFGDFFLFADAFGQSAGQ